MKLRYSRRAVNDLNSIHEYLKARSPRGAALERGELGSRAAVQACDAERYGLDSQRL